MDVSFSSWLVILLALAGANLPFFNDRILALLPLKADADGQPRRKRLAVRLLELLVMYCLVGACAFALEARIGNAFPQSWEFYAITGCLFIVFAFPGFVLRYLRKRR
ncbi:hypothetical protein AAKU55_000144 [Oxalobacteraceae bacterium GrIS 1.11]